jgi:hypothetical protein
MFSKFEWRDAILPAMTAPLARWYWWFTYCPTERGPAVAFVIVSYFSGVVATVRAQVAAPRSHVVFWGPGAGASGLDLGWPGRGP